MSISEWSSDVCSSDLAGAVIARMDTRDLEAQLRSAEAQVQQALQYRTQVQEEIVQRRSELDLADKDLQRALVLVGKNYVSEQEHTSELQSLMRISYAVFCLKKKN